MKEKLTRGVLWLGSARFAANLLGLASTLLLARLLTPDDFGLVAISNTLITILASVTEMSLATALIHHRAPTDQHFNSAWTLNMLRALLLAGAVAAASPWLAQLYHDERLMPVLLVLSLSLLIGGMGNPRQVELTRRLEFWQEFAVVVSQKLAGFAVGVALALAWRNHWALIAGTLASQVVGVVVSYCVAPYCPKPSLAKVRELWSFSGWITLSQIINTLNWRLDHFLIGTFIGTRSLGAYTVGDNLAGMPTRETTGPLEQALFPGLRSVVDDPERLRNTYTRAQGLISMVALPIGFACSALAEPLVQLVLGPQWGAATLVVQVLSCVFALQTLSSAVHPLAMAKGQTRRMFGRDLFAFAVRVPIILAGMWWAGMVGVVFARIVSGLLSIIINAHVVRSMIGLRIIAQLTHSWRSILSASVMWALLTLLQGWVPVDGPAWERAALIASYALGALLCYLLMHFGLWHLLGKPSGAEHDVHALIGKRLHRMRRSLSY